MQVLSRRGKNNPVLIGAPGVGKTAIVEALCQRLVSSDVPEGLKGRRIFSLDLGSLVAGTSLRGQFEERVKGIVDEIVDSRGRVIVYIDEIHNMVGAGGQEGSGSAANLLKPALARGELRCIGSTTQEEYKQYIEEDKALVRRFQEVEVKEPDQEHTVAILRGIKRRYEVHHGVRVLDAALVAAAKFSERYITDRHQPDKAIDLIDEAASRIRLEIDSKPTEIDVMERRTQSLEIERAAIEGETSSEAVESKTRIDKELAELKGRVEELSVHWRQEKALLDRITEIQEQLEATERNIERARRDTDLGRAAELQYGVKIELEKELEERSATMANLQVDLRLLKQEVDAGDVADVVSDITSIPVNRMLEGEREKLLRMEETLAERVVGQDEAILSISKAVRMSRAGVSDPNKPIGSFLFVGPTGVGKTELAKALAEFLFDSEEALIRIDMSEYQEQAKVNTLIGSARGYVGSEKGGVLTEAVRRRPYSVVLFDEAEKAHPKVFDLLLQVLDEGRLSDSQGLEVDFTNTIVIMTSNVGSRQILDMTGQLSNEEMEVQIRALLKDYLKPEFINRIQDIVVFNALRLGAIRKIVDIQLRSLGKILDEQKLGLSLSDDAKDWLAQAGYEPEYGARPLKRAILNHIQDPLAMLILEGEFEEGETAEVDVDDEGEALVFTGY
jgi:ATP-dependent Clp protease ATP-binding subunit ClpB